MGIKRTATQAEKMTASLAERLREALVDSGLRQSDIAGKIGCDASYITRWKNNKYRPSKIYLAKIAEVTNVDLDWLLTGNGSKEVAAVESTSFLNTTSETSNTATIENDKEKEMESLKDKLILSMERERVLQARVTDLQEEIYQLGKPQALENKAN